MKLIPFILLLAATFSARASIFVFAEGDSLTYGYGLSPVGSNWVGQLAQRNPSVTFSNNGVSGKRWESAWTPHVVTAETTSALSGASASSPRTVVVWCGINDIAGGNSFTTTTNLIGTWMDAVRSADAGAKVVGCTVLKYVGLAGAGETFRTNLNEWIKTGAGFDYTVDLASVAELTDPSNGTYFQGDGVHTTIAGNEKVAAAVESVLSGSGLLTDAAVSYFVRKDGNDSNDGTADTSGGAWLTIGKAESTVPAGSTVFVRAGRYDEYVTHNGASNVTYIGTSTTTNRGFLISKSGIVIRDWHMNGSNVVSGERVLDLATGGNSCTFSNISMIRSLSTTDEGGGIQCIQETFSNYFDRIYMVNPNKIAVTFAGVAHTLTNSTLLSSNGWDCLTIICDNARIENNTFDWANPEDWNPDHTDFVQSFGDNSDHCTNVLIAGNLFQGHTNGTVQFGNITDDQENGDIGGWTFRNNVIVDISNCMNLYAPGFSFYNNTFVRVGPISSWAIIYGSGTAGHSDNLNIRNNIFYRCGVPSNAGVGWYGGDVVTNSVFDYNLVVGTGAGTTKTGFTETHGINGSDPLFTSATDYRLLTNSPAIGAGVDLSAYFTTDKNGVTRTVPWDIGAYVYGTNAPPTPPVVTSGNLTVTGTLYLR